MLSLQRNDAPPTTRTNTAILNPSNPDCRSSWGRLFALHLRNVRGAPETDIEHIVARSEAHDSGLCSASPERKREFARGFRNLTLSAPHLNRNLKGAKDAADWTPGENRCWFAWRVIDVRRAYDLTIDRREADALDAILETCPESSPDKLPACSGFTKGKQFMKTRTCFVSVYVALGLAATLHAQADCADWNTRAFFEVTEVSDVTRCLQSGLDPQARNEFGNTGFRQ